MYMCSGDNFYVTAVGGDYRWKHWMGRGFSDKGPWGCCGGEGLRPLLAGMEVGVLHAPPQHPPTVIRAGGIGLGVGP